MRSPKERFLCESVFNSFPGFLDFCHFGFELLEKTHGDLCRFFVSHRCTPAINLSLGVIDTSNNFSVAVCMIQLFVEFLVPKPCQLNRQQICRHCQ
jgi:hypothetical protein